jgi:hypothetical protein
MVIAAVTIAGYMEPLQCKRIGDGMVKELAGSIIAPNL